ncbi:hypothetical protein M9H77_12032 [Catharanthus roseus]|uniref:Uncharacterized protein n=1 Tax=Catharanthus roseus TaxID=4058 RepID=A0ACC0BGF2_CATRO|nr:hypothetical protein M9H77_12032 [Catharanthus roseus]
MSMINLKYEAWFCQFAMHNERYTKYTMELRRRFPSLTEITYRRESVTGFQSGLGRNLGNRVMGISLMELGFMQKNEVEQVTYTPYPATKSQKSDYWVIMKSRPRILDVPLVHIPYQEDVDIVETSRIDIDVQEIGPLVH